MNIIDIYKNHIYNKFKDLLRAKKIEDLDNKDLCKIFEYFSCIKLTEEYKSAFYEYADIDLEFKELNQMTRTDTGIDCCNLIDTIVQCKLRKDTLTWKECSTFFGSQNLYNEELNETIIRWKKLIITRNSECKLSTNLQEKHKLFNDKCYSRDEIIKYCESLLETPPIIPIVNKVKDTIRDYQKECIDLIISSKENVIISLPTGTGKNFIIVHSLEPNKKYLILVPRIILMEQIQDEIKKHNPKLKNKIQLIGDSKNVFDETKDITICCYNSVKIVEEHSTLFHKIFIDEAHHINKPEIYQNDEQDLEQDLENPARKFSSNGEYDDDEDYDSDIENDYDSDENSDIDDYDTNDEEQDEDEEQDLENPEHKDSENETEKDNDDEIKDKSTYINIIHNFTKLNNNIYLSATIDAQEGFKYYEKNLRDMIDKKYLSDYTINIPIFTDDPTNKNICEYLLKEYRNIIIYCNTKKEGKLINKLMNELQNKSSEYIDCDTTKSKRKNIIDKFKSGELPFLVNVRILVEGFDAPITKGVCFMHLPSSKTTLIQIIGRALRLHEMKTIANIILPFSSKKDDEASIKNFMKVMAKNDRRIKKSFESKKLGGYISLVKVVGEENYNDDEESEENEETDEIRDINFKYDLIFDSIGIMKNSEEIFIKRLEEIKTYIDINNKTPSQINKDKTIRRIGCWMSTSIQNYSKKINNMKDEIIRKLWEEFINDENYKKYFLSQYDTFVFNLNKVKNYININKQRPSTHSKDKDIKSLAYWISDCQKYYIKKIARMTDETIYKLWTEFINDARYKEYFLSQYDSFVFDLNKLKIYIDTNKQRPPIHNKDKNINSMSQWIGHCQDNYTKKIHNMKYDNIKNLWEEFINDKKYKKYFQLPTMLELFNNDLNKVKLYINIHNKRPSQSNKDKSIKTMGNFIQTCSQNYTKAMKNMKYENIRKLWEEFINDENYKKYFLSQYDKFVSNLNELKKYFDINNKRPSYIYKDKHINSMAKLISDCQRNYTKKLYNMKDETIYNLWTEFINDPKYKDYF